MLRVSTISSNDRPNASGRISCLRKERVDLHVLVLATDTSSRQLVGKVIGQGGCETLHDARVESLLDGASGLLNLGLLFVDGGLRCAILEDAAAFRIGNRAHH